ncbi:MAG: hypothetical protein ABJO67_16430 [Pseudoruegeria sp.]
MIELLGHAHSFSWQEDKVPMCGNLIPSGQAYKLGFFTAVSSATDFILLPKNALCRREEQDQFQTYPRNNRKNLQYPIGKHRQMRAKHFIWAMQFQSLGQRPMMCGPQRKWGAEAPQFC